MQASNINNEPIENFKQLKSSTDNKMQESFEKLLPSCIGTNIENKPARLRRNEKFHSDIHKEFTPAIQQTIQMISSRLEYKNSLPCPND